jgi:hypothetical protein
VNNGHYHAVKILARLRHFRLRLMRRLAELIEDTTSFVAEPHENKP